MREHIEYLLHFSKHIRESPAVSAAIDLLRAAEPKDEREENGIVSRAAYRVAEAGTQHACDVAQMVKEERAQARAEGYAQGQREHVAVAERCARQEHSLKLMSQLGAETERQFAAKLTAAQAEIAQLRTELQTTKPTWYVSNKLAETEVKLTAAQAEIVMYRKQRGEDRAACDRSIEREARAQNEYASAASELSDLKAQLSAAQAEVENQQSQVADLQRLGQELETKLTNLRSAAERADARVGGDLALQKAIKASL